VFTFASELYPFERLLVIFKTTKFRNVLILVSTL
jgi:hypothetical protein